MSVRGWWGAITRIGYRPQRQARVRLPVRLVPRLRRRPMRGAYAEAVLHDTFSVRARLVQRSARLVMQPLLKVTPINERSIRRIQRLDRLHARGPRSRFVEPVPFELNGVHVESMTHRYGPTSDMTILYLHGGGFFSCGIETHRRICERLALLTGATVISVEYTQLPDGPVAASVRDAIAAYEGVLALTDHPDKVVVAGDSAGGYLTMKVAELATRRGLTHPAALLGFSPLLSLDPERDDKGVARIDPVNDAYLPPSRLPRIRELWLPEGAVIEGFASPLNATAYIDSPTFLTATEDEMLRPEVEAMGLRLAERGVRVEVHLWRKQVHAFPVLADLMPESRHALLLAADFARRAVGETALVQDDRPIEIEPGAQDDLDEMVDDAAQAS